jgi:nucleotide-binding universal stress UspA family protein
LDICWIRRKALKAEIKKVLCATDLSDKCDHIYRCAMDLACKKDGALTVIHVINQRSINVAKKLAYFFNVTQKDIAKEKAYNALQRMEQQLSSFVNKKEFENYAPCLDLVVDMVVHHGKIAEEILEKANRFGYDAIVLGASNNSFLNRFLPGDSTKKVLKQSKKTVFIAALKKGKIKITNHEK